MYRDIGRVVFRAVVRWLLGLLGWRRAAPAPQPDWEARVLQTPARQGYDIVEMWRRETCETHIEQQHS